MNSNHFSFRTFLLRTLKDVFGKRVLRGNDFDFGPTQPTGSDLMSDLFYEIKTERGYRLISRRPRKTDR